MDYIMEEQSPEKNQVERLHMENLPYDMVKNILERLPAKSLVRFKCISKWWYNLMKDPAFIDAHYIQRRTKHRILLMRRFLQNKDMLSFHSFNGEELKFLGFSLALHLTSVDPSYACDNNNLLFGPCKGILCLFSPGPTFGANETIVLCNPCLRELKYLPVDPFICPKNFSNHICGVGVGCSDSNTDLKIVLIRCITDDQDSDVTYPMVHLYSLKTNSWKQVKYEGIVFPNGPDKGSCNSILLNGCCHWYAKTDLDQSSLAGILTFDMHSENFTQIELPDSVIHMYNWGDYLIVHKEHLNLIRCGFENNADGSVNTDNGYVIEVWFMKEYGVKSSWVKQFVMSSELRVTPFCWIENSLLMEEWDGGLVCIKPITNEVKKFPVFWEPWSSRVTIYEESLLSLNEVTKSC